MSKDPEDPIPSIEDVKKFRTIPLSSNGSLFSKYENSFTGTNAIKFMKKKFKLSTKDAVEWGHLFLQGNVIKPENYRLEQVFKNKPKYIYSFYDEEIQNLFWLDEYDELIENTDLQDDSNVEGMEIPKIPALPFIGNAFNVAGPGHMDQSMVILGRDLCPKYGGIFRLSLMGHNYVVVSDPDMVEQVFEAPQFGKLTENDAIFKELRSIRGDGLTTITDSQLHKQVQSLIAPTLVKSCFKQYAPVISDMANKSFREEIGTKAKNINMKPFFKKCTLRSLAYITMGIDLYAGKDWETFCEVLTYVFSECLNRTMKGTKYVPPLNKKFKSAVKIIKSKIAKHVSDRKAEHELHGKDPATYDLLDIMLTSPIAEDNGRKVYMSQDLIRDNLVTILSAGHSTTTCMLSWACNYLYDSSLGNSDYRYHLIQEVDALSGGDRKYIPTVGDTYTKLNFMTCVLKETLRMCPPVPTVVRHCRQTTHVCGYKVKKGETVMVSCLGTHLHPKSFDDAEAFDPYRFMEKTFKKPMSFIPWVGGPRQCIGREFALLTGRLVFFQLLNQYNLELSPKANVKEAGDLFVFPTGLLMNLELRKDFTAISSSLSTLNITEENKNQVQINEKKNEMEESNSNWDQIKAIIRKNEYKVDILSGTKTNGGNCDTISQLLVDKANLFNFQLGNSPYSPNTFFADVANNKPKSMTIVALVIATYQGKPANNTLEAYKWLVSTIERLEKGEDLSDYLSNVNFIVFGCGNTNWSTTYQKIPKFFDENLPKLGAKRIYSLTTYDESSDDLDEIFEEFFKNMAPKLLDILPTISKRRVTIANRRLTLQQSRINIQPPSSAFHMLLCGHGEEIGFPPVIPTTGNKKVFNCAIKKIENITPKADVSTIHIELEMQNGMKYRAGDHLVVCPITPNDIVQRALARFIDYDENSIIKWSPVLKQSKKSRFHLPLSVQMSIKNVFSNLIDLKAIPPKQFLINYSNIVENPNHGKELKNIASNTNVYKEWVKENSPISIIDIIEKYPTQNTELPRLIEILPILKPRSYSICSSPKIDSSTVHICVGVVEDKIGDKLYQGVCSYYLKTLVGTENSSLNVYVEPASESFDVPKDDNTPILLISAGTGFAPMRSFVQERKARNAKGELHIFFGCRHESKDWLYCDELKQYQEEGLITNMFVGFSRSEQFPRQYVQERILEQADLVWDAIENKGAYIYVCGSGSRVGTGTHNALVDIIVKKTGKDKGYAEEYLENLESNDRYEQDVWG